MKQTQEEFEQQMMDEMQEAESEKMEDSTEDQMYSNKEFQEAYGVPEPEQQFNQHTFLANSLDRDASEKVTFLHESELGRPLFNVRFLLDIEDITKYYLDEIAKKLGVENEIAKYFREKINNVCSSGMSNKGFVQNLNVTRKMDTRKERIKNLQQGKGGK